MPPAVIMSGGIHNTSKKHIDLYS